MSFVAGFEKFFSEGTPDRRCTLVGFSYLKAPIYRGFLLSDYRITALGPF